MRVEPREHEAEQREAERAAALERQRWSQVRGLLMLGGAVLGAILWRARPLLLFRSGWWRLW